MLVRQHCLKAGCADSTVLAVYFYPSGMMSFSFTKAALTSVVEGKEKQLAVRSAAINKHERAAAATSHRCGGFETCATRFHSLSGMCQ